VRQSQKRRFQNGGSQRQLLETRQELPPHEPGVPSYCIFDGLQWESKRGLGRFAAQLNRHLDRMPWRRLTYPRPQWRSSVGRVLLNEAVEPVWLEVLNPEVAIYPHNVLPSLFGSHRSLRVLVLHDVLFLDRCNDSAGNRYRSAKLKKSLANADLIVTVSEASRTEIAGLLSDEKRIMVLPNALGESFESVCNLERRDRTGPARILHFGGHAPSKNTKSVFEAISRLRREGCEVQLTLAAMSGNAELAEQWRRETQLRSEALTLLPMLSDEELKQVYAEATVHCMPSTGEGFGIPVIEAAKCGTPNVLTPLPVFRELMGGDAFFADSTSSESITRSLKECLAAENAPITERARARTERFVFDSVHAQHAVPIFHAIEEMAWSRRSKSSSEDR
jgi:glycosyltransferase involved in cell wall biosynthesis